jgi:hypothetical protein
VVVGGTGWCGMGVSRYADHPEPQVHRRVTGWELIVLVWWNQHLHHVLPILPGWMQALLGQTIALVRMGRRVGISHREFVCECVGTGGRTGAVRAVPR